MNNLSNIGTIRDLMSRHGFTFSKALGQNFLINPSVCPRMAESAVEGDDWGVLEIGPGIGVLTRELSLRARKVVAVELDSRLLPVLDETLAGCDNVEIINADVLKLDLRSVISERFSSCRGVSVCANLPYYVTSPIIMSLLESRPGVSSVTVMVQKEAAERLCAEAGTRQAGAVTIAVRYYSEPKQLFTVSRGSFMPAPNVDSAVIKLSIRSAPPFEVPNERIFFRLVRAAFSQRRKTLANSLTAGGFATKENAALMLTRADIPLSARAEQLTLEEFGNLSRIAAEILTCQTN